LAYKKLAGDKATAAASVGASSEAVGGATTDPTPQPPLASTLNGLVGLQQEEAEMIAAAAAAAAAAEAVCCCCCWW
jgi:hypothetical protein